jgi:hypothetical protein
MRGRCWSVPSCLHTISVIALAPRGKMFSPFDGPGVLFPLTAFKGAGENSRQG